jgi:putative flippase GtrA
MIKTHINRARAIGQKHKDKVMYFSVGIFAFMVDALTFTILRGLNLNIGLANIGAMLAGMVTSFSLNWRVVFKNKHYKNPVWLMITIFLILNIFNWWFSTNFIRIVSIAITDLAERMFSLSVSRSFAEFIAKMASLGFIMIWNFILFKYLIFKEEQPSKE